VTGDRSSRVDVVVVVPRASTESELKNHTLRQSSTRRPLPQRVGVMPRVAELVSYPVKSCAGVSLDAVALTSTGLAFDRFFCVVGKSDGTFISQRTHPRLALVRCDIEPREAFTDPSIDRVVLTCETASMSTPLRVEARLGVGADERLEVTCWEWRGTCADCGEEASRWFTEFLNQDDAGRGRSYALARWMGKGGAPAAAQDDDGLDVDDETTRLTSENYGSKRCTTTLSDGYPMLLVNRSSVERLRDVVREESPSCSVDARRFRGNVVVDDAPPYAEDLWSTVRIADVVDAELCKPCSRCSIPAVDPDTGESSGGAPLVRALSRLRSGAALGTSNRLWRASPFFGWNLVCPDAPRDALPVLRVGDDVAVLETRRAFP